MSITDKETMTEEEQARVIQAGKDMFAMLEDAAPVLLGLNGASFLCTNCFLTIIGRELFIKAGWHDRQYFQSDEDFKAHLTTNFQTALELFIATCNNETAHPEPTHSGPSTTQ